MYYFIKTFGCQMNFSDSERIAGFFELQKIQPVEKMEMADIVIFNTCGIRQTAENSAMGLIHNLHKKKPEIFIILTGCLAKRQDVQKKMKDKVSLFLPIEKLFELSFPFNLKNFKQIKTNLGETPHYLSLTPKYSKINQAFVPIMTGCNNFCSYCVVPYARGPEKSRSPEEIFQEIKKLKFNGCKEITLLGQNVNSYFYNKTNLNQKKENELTNLNFPHLLNCLAKSFPQINFKFLTSHPKDFSKELMQIIAENQNISKEIHLPLQSGSDRILKMMNRPYTQKKYLTLIKKARQIIPSVRFTTDIIVGFPGETREDLEKTAEVIRIVKYTLIFINKYSPRPGTKAFEMKDSVSWNEKKERENYLKKVLKEL